jgi:hypothetical protein
MSRFTVRQRALLLVILMGGFALRLHRLGADSLWYDETVSALLASKPLPAMWAHTARDIHPPLYYALLHGWRALAGGSEFALAFLSLWFGLAHVALVAHLGLRFYRPQVGLLAALLAAVSPLGVWYSQEVRMYTLGAFWLLLLPIVMARFLRKDDRGWRWPMAYAVLAALGLWTLYYSAFALVALNLLVLAWLARQPRRLGRWLAAQVGVILLYAPWLPHALRQALDPPVPPWRQVTDPLTLVATAVNEVGVALLAGQSLEPRSWWPWGLLGWGLALAAWALPDRFEPGRRRGTWLLLTSLVGPLLLIVLASLTLTPLYHVRYAALYSGAYPVLVAAGLLALAGESVRGAHGRRGWRRGLAVVLLTAIVAVDGLSLHRFFTRRFTFEAADDLRGAVAFLAAQVGPQDAILVNAGYLYPALVVYWPEPIGWLGRLSAFPPPAAAVGEGPVVVLTGHVDGDPGIGWGDPASDFYAISAAETAARLEALFAAFDTVWQLRGYDTVNDPNGFIRTWLESHAHLYVDQVFAGTTYVRVQAWRSRPTAVTRPAQPLTAAFADGIRLVGYTLSPASLQPGRYWRLALYWQATGPIRRPWKVFNQLLDAADAVVAQADAYPVWGAFPSDRWPPGALVTTAFVLPLPATLPAGSYRLVTGFYDEGTGERLPLTTGGDVVILEVFTLGAEQGSAEGSRVLAWSAARRFRDR